MASRFQRIAKNGMFAAIPLAVTLLLFEGGLRLFTPAPEVIDLERLYRDDDVDYVETVGEPDERFIIVTPQGTRLKKNFKAVIHNHHLSRMTVTVETNSLGYRDDEIGAKREDDFRVLVLGDSITFAEYAPADLTYPAFIQKSLERSGHPTLRGKRIKAINTGIGALDLANEYAILMETGLSTEPDVVVVGLYLNDAYRSVSVHVSPLPDFLRQSYVVNFIRSRLEVLRKQYAYEQEKMTLIDERPAAELERERFAASHELGPRKGWKTSEISFNRLIYDSFFDVGFAWSGKFWNIIEGNVILFREAGAEHGFNLVFVLLPIKHQVQTDLDRSEPQRYFGELMTRLGVDHLDLLPLLRRQYQEDGLDLYYDHCHMRPAGNEFVGNAIGGYIAGHVLPR